MKNAVKKTLNTEKSFSVYLDSTMLLPYYLAEGAEFCFDEEGSKVIPPWAEDSSEGGCGENFLDDLLLNDKEVKEFGTIMHLVTYGHSSVRLVTSPIGWLEFIKRYSEPETKEVKAKKGGCSLNLGFLRTHGLAGVNCPHDFRLHITDADIAWYLGDLSASHVSIPEIMTIHSAKQMGCTHLATLEESLHANKEFIEEKSGIKLLSTAEELLRLLQANLIQTERGM